MTSLLLATTSLSRKDNAMLETVLDLAAGVELSHWERTRTPDEANVILIDLEDRTNRELLRRQQEKQCTQPLVLAYSSNLTTLEDFEFQLHKPASYHSLVATLQQLEKALRDLKKHPEASQGPVTRPLLHNPDIHTPELVAGAENTLPGVATPESDEVTTPVQPVDSLETPEDGSTADNNNLSGTSGSLVTDGSEPARATAKPSQSGEFPTIIAGPSIQDVDTTGHGLFDFTPGIETSPDILEEEEIVAFNAESDAAPPQAIDTHYEDISEEFLISDEVVLNFPRPDPPEPEAPRHPEDDPGSSQTGYRESEFKRTFLNPEISPGPGDESETDAGMHTHGNSDDLSPGGFTDAETLRPVSTARTRSVDQEVQADSSSNTINPVQTESPDMFEIRTRPARRFYPETRLLGLIHKIQKQGKSSKIRHHTQPSIYIYPDKGKYFCSEELDRYPALFRTPFGEFQVEILKKDEKSTAPYAGLLRPLPELLYCAALYGSEGRLLENANPFERFKLYQQPDLISSPHTNEHKILADYLQHRSANIQTIALETGIRVETVINFCNACREIQLIKTVAIEGHHMQGKQGARQSTEHTGSEAPSGHTVRGKKRQGLLNKLKTTFLKGKSPEESS